MKAYLKAKKYLEVYVVADNTMVSIEFSFPHETEVSAVHSGLLPQLQHWDHKQSQLQPNSSRLCTIWPDKTINRTDKARPGMVSFTKPSSVGYFFSDKPLIFFFLFPDTMYFIFQYKKYNKDVNTVRQRVFGIVNFINTVRVNRAEKKISRSDLYFLICKLYIVLL